MNNNVLIILGMHRSGTSLVSNWLEKCGLNIGDYKLEGSFGNKDGHFEDYDFYSLHSFILQTNNMDKYGLFNINMPVVNEYFLDRMRNLVEFKNSRRKIWGWKEPRTCLFYKQYLEILPDAYYLVLFREFELVVDSLTRREMTAIKTSLKGYVKLKWKLFPSYYRSKVVEKYNNIYLKTWILYNKCLLDLIKQAKKENVSVLNYSQLLKNDNHTINLLNNKGFELNYVPFSEVFKEEKINKKSVGLNFDRQLLEEANDISMQFASIINSTKDIHS